MAHRFLLSKWLTGSVVLFWLLLPGHICADVAARDSQHKKNNIKFRNIETPNLVKLGQIWSISEDEQGFLWVGGSDGLARFDGLNTKLYQNDVADPNSLPKGFISDIHQGADGRVWISGNTGLYEFIPDKDIFERRSVWINQDEILTVWKISEDRDGNLWLGISGGGIGKYNPRTDRFIRIVEPNLDEEYVGQQNFFSVLVDSKNNVWAGDDFGLIQLDLETNSFRRFTHDRQNSGSIISGTINVIKEDDRGKLWIGSSDGLSVYSPSEDVFRRYDHNPNSTTSLTGNNVSDIVFDKEGHVWIAVDGDGLNLYVPEQDDFRRFTAHPEIRGSIKNNSVRRLFVSELGDLWLGYHPFGLAVSDNFASIFESFTSESNNTNSLSNSTVHALYSSDPAILWAAGEDGVNKINLNTRAVSHYRHIAGNPNSLSAHAALSVLYDSQQRLWAGTWSGGLNLYDEKTGQYTHFKHDADDKNSISNNNVWALVERDKNSLWVGTSAGLEILDIPSKTFSKVEGIHHRVGNLVPYKDDLLIVVDDATARILDTKTMELISNEAGWQKLGRVVNVNVGLNDEIWFNTFDGVKRQKSLGGPIESFAEASVEVQNLARQSVTDMDGLLWLGSNSGVVSFDAENNLSATYNSTHGLPSDTFAAARAALLLDDGRIAMGGAGGIVVFDPRDTASFEDHVKPVLIELHVLDQVVNVNAPDSPLRKVINRAEKITLNHHQNVFSIAFSALDFHLAPLNTFRFRLLGFDQDWRSADLQRLATYTNLDPGEYLFQVMTADDQGRWNKNSAEIKIEVLPPWWREWWAYCLYLLALMIFVVAVMFGIWQNSRRANELKVINKLKEVDRLKDEFLAKTSHELRTPLNGIIGLTEIIVSGSLGAVSKPIEDKLNIVIASGKRLANIINDILDFSKLRNHAIELNREAVDIYQLVQSVVVLSEPLLGMKNVELINDVPKDLAPVMLDKQRIIQVLFNLVGNAIKFTEKGEVKIFATLNEKELCVSVQDSGVGIRQQDQARIFQPFEQSLQENSGGHFGTGLGLAVSRQLIELHGGYIALYSKYGEGANFYFVVPAILAAENSLSQNNIEKVRDHQRRRFTDADVNVTNLSKPANTIKRHNLSEANAGKNASSRVSDRSVRVLIVDDEPVNRLVLEGFLRDEHYDIVEAGSGAEALSIVETSAPFDIVLLDVMLPGMSGYEICAEIRKNYPLPVLPILFLTAKSQIEDMQKGYEVGANDFLYKPVNRDELLAKMKMQLFLYASLDSSKTKSAI